MKIYISSTFEDLKEHREKVYRQLRKMGHDVISMEDYVAENQRPVSKCLADVAEADIYVGILAWRYGYIPKTHNPENRSITELEYRKALDTKKGCLIFLLNQDASWSPRLMDAHTGAGDMGKRISRFRKELAQRHTVGWFDNADQLASAVSAAVYRVQFDAREPRIVGGDARAVPAASRAIKRHAAVRKDYSKLWKPGETLHVRFIDGSPKQRCFVERFAPIWSAYANLRFEFSSDPASEIRVSFNNSGVWAYFGTDALHIQPDLPTVNFGRVADETPDNQAEYEILRTFGHVVGLYNEHQNPLAKIPWNKQAVYKAYKGPPQFWSREDVNRYLFATYPRKFLSF
jgi:hypothetical protein